MTFHNTLRALVAVRTNTHCRTNHLGKVGAALALACSGAALAQPAEPGQAYRCQAPDGRVTYSQQPCGDQVQLHRMDDARTPAQVLDKELMNERDSKLSRQMARQRRHEERAAAQAEAMPLTRPAKHHGSTTDMHAASATASAPSDTTHRLKRTRHFTALVPKAPKSSKTSKANDAAASSPKN
jgi:hypothetical protein